ncbi:MAG: hypothetical protein HW387_1691 [Parachlamydiales bacterium]|nr:hypothetical protein [Parachlamydiales bacterium]
MQQKLSSQLFEQPQIFFGALDGGVLEENEVDLDWGLVFDASAFKPENSITGLYFHWMP